MENSRMEVVWRKKNYLAQVIFANVNKANAGIYLYKVENTAHSRADVLNWARVIRNRNPLTALTMERKDWREVKEWGLSWEHVKCLQLSEWFWSTPEWALWGGMKPERLQGICFLNFLCFSRTDHSPLPIPHAPWNGGAWGTSCLYACVTGGGGAFPLILTFSVLSEAQKSLCTAQHPVVWVNRQRFSIECWEMVGSQIW